MRKGVRHQESVQSTSSSAALITRDRTPDAAVVNITSHRRASDQSNVTTSTGYGSQCSVQSRPLMVTASVDKSENGSESGVKEVKKDEHEREGDQSPNDPDPEQDLIDFHSGVATDGCATTERRRSVSANCGGKRASMTATQKRAAFGRKSSTLTETLAKQLDFDLGFSSSSQSEKEDEHGELLDELYRRMSKRIRKENRSTTLENYFTNPRGKIWSKKRCKEVFAGKRMRKMAFWFIVIFLAALTVKDVIELVAEYCDNPKQSDINIRFNKTMKVPNITFCMRRMQAFSHFDLKNVTDWDGVVQRKFDQLRGRDEFLRRPWDFRLAAEGYQVISALSSIERETTALGTLRSIRQFRNNPRFDTKRRMIKMWMAELQKRDVSFDEFTQKVGYEVFRRSNQKFERTSYNENEEFVTRFRTSWISEQEFCFQPRYEGASLRDITDQGYFFHFVTSHDSRNLDDKKVDCMTVDFHGRPSSLTRYTQATAVNDGFIDDLCLGMWHEVTVDIKALYEMLENDEEGTECREMTADSENEFDCRMRCRMEMIRDVCHCMPATLSYLVGGDHRTICDYTNCAFDPQKRNFSEEACSQKCRRSCVQVRFNVQHTMKGKSQREDLTRVDLLWGSFEYLVMKQDWVWSVTSFIAALGGSIGMWLGLSILSLIQGGTYLYGYLTENVIKKNIARRLSTMSFRKIEKTKDCNDNETKTPRRSRQRRRRSSSAAEKNIV